MVDGGEERQRAKLGWEGASCTWRDVRMRREITPLGLTVLPGSGCNPGGSQLLRNVERSPGLFCERVQRAKERTQRNTKETRTESFS